MNFQILLKFLQNYGVESGHLVNTTDECVLGTHDSMIYKDNINYSCINMSRFIAALFTNKFNVDSLDDFDNIDAKFYDKLMKKSFTDMNFTWFHIDNEIGVHECSLIYISEDEIYFIDYYMETQRKNFFRIIKFKNKKQAKYLIQEALFNQNEEAFDILFDFQESVQSHYNVTTNCNIFKMTKLPTFKKLQKLWEISLPILEKKMNFHRENAKTIDFNRELYWDKFEETNDYDFETQFTETVADLTNKYNKIVQQFKYYNAY